MGAGLVQWWLQGEPVQNLGDFLSSLLADELFLPVGLDAAAIHVIGSVIDDDFLRDEEHSAGVVFWGAGCRDDRGLSPELRSRARILAVRGPRSRDVLGLGPEVPLGDPAFLLPALLDVERRSPRTRGRSIVVPHFHDTRPDAELLAATGAEVVVRPAIAATREALLATIEDIASADLVLSGSLHAAIVAMAFDVPFAFWESGSTDLPFKWQDTAELVGVPATFVGDVAEARSWWEACGRGRVTPPDLLELVAAAPLLVRPDALLRIVAYQVERVAPKDRQALVDRAIEVHATHRGLVDAIALDVVARGEAVRELANDGARLTTELIETRAELARSGEELDRARAELARTADELDRARTWLAESEAHWGRLDRELAEARAARPPVGPDPAALPRPLPIEIPGRVDRARLRSRVGWVNPLFDAHWYAAHHPDVGLSRLPPTAHYLRHGRAELRRPNEHFDPTWYLTQHPDVRRSGMDPVDHWWFHGAREGRDPSPGFDTAWYLAAHPDVLARGQNPLLHWLREGRARGLATRPTTVEAPARGVAAVPASTRAATPPPGPPPASPAVATWPASPEGPFVPAGATLARRDPALVDVPIVLGMPTLGRAAGSATVRCPLGDGRSFWLRVVAPDAILDRLVPRVEPFIGPALLLAGQEGRPLRIVPPLDARFERRLRHQLIPLIGGYTADRDIVVARTVDPAAEPPPAPTGTAGLLFSGGVDSLHALDRMQREGWPPDVLISVDAGAHDTDTRCRDRRREGVRSAAEALSIPLVTIDSNLHLLAWIPHQAVHTIRNLSAASILQPAVGSLVYAATHRVESTSFLTSKAYPDDRMELMTSTAIRWGGLEVHLLGIGEGRAVKTARIAEMPIARDALDVCTDQAYQAMRPVGAPVNCGQCAKCVRTILVLDHLDRLDRFAGRFDLEAFGAVRTSMVERILASPGLLDSETRVVLGAPRGTVPPIPRGTLPPPPDAPPVAPDAAPNDDEGAAPAPSPQPTDGPPLTLEAVTVERSPGRLRLGCPLGDGRTIWIEAEGPDELLVAPEPGIVPFVPLAYLLGLLEGRDVEVRTPLPATFARRVRDRIAPTMAAILANPDVEITVRSRPDDPPRTQRPDRPERIALLFSSGVDSFAALVRMRREGWAPDLLVNVNAGAHDQDRACWRRRLERIRGVAAALGIPVVTLDTNIHELRWEPHATAHAIRNLATASVLEPVVEVLAYSSGHRLEATDLMIGRRLDQDLIEPISVDLARWGELDIALVGNDVRRIDKTASLVDEPLAWRFLDVCVDQGYQATSAADRPTNCGRCNKCARVILTLEHLGALDRFAGCFDLAAFAVDRDRLTTTLMTRDHPIDDEFRELLASPRGTLPPFIRGSLPPRSAHPAPEP